LASGSFVVIQTADSELLPSASASDSPAATFTPAAEATPEPGPYGTPTQTQGSGPTDTPSATQQPTDTPLPTAAPTPAPTAVPTAAPTPTPLPFDAQVTVVDHCFDTATGTEQAWVRIDWTGTIAATLWDSYMDGEWWGNVGNPAGDPVGWGMYPGWVTVGTTHIGSVIVHAGSQLIPGPGPGGAWVSAPTLVNQGAPCSP
jgi:hypothetical protein